MKIKLLCVGKSSKSFLQEGENEYLKRLQKYVSFEKIELPDLKNAQHLSEELIKEKEGLLLLEKIQQQDVIVLLDEKGKSFTSKEFSVYLQQHFLSGNKQLVFVVGGPYGFSPAVYARASDKLALSKMTFSHQMIRLFFIEQVYRAMSILNNAPYHHE